MFGNIFIISVSLIVIMSFSPSPITRSYGICRYGLHINHDHLLWNTPLDLAKLFGVICYSLGVAVIGPTSYNTMKEPRKYTFALIVSVIIAVLVYMSLGVLGAMSYSMDPSGRWP